MGLFVENISWNLVGERLADNYLPVLPIGAECKEHGFHLPMNTDAIQIQWLLEHLVQDMNIMVWPIVNYGFYPAFTNYCGSISLSRKTFVALIKEIVDGILSHGAKKVVVINGGISTISSLVEISLSKTYAGKIHLCNIYHGSKFQQVQRSVSQQRNGGHADEVETSLMLVIAPDSVELEKAAPEESAEFVKGPLQFLDAGVANFSMSGAMGNPTLANRKKGQELLNAMHYDVKGFLEHVIQLENNINNSR